MSLTIRPVTDEDYEGIAEIYAQESVIAETSQIPHGNARFWRELYSSKGTGGIELVALLDQRIVGHLGILMNQRPRRKHVASFGLAVHGDCHGAGIGKALMEELIRLCDNWLNLVRIELDVFCDNKAAVALYRKFGFEIEGTSRYDTYRDGKYRHSYRMARFNPHYRDFLD